MSGVLQQLENIVQTLIVKVDIAWFSSVARDTSIPSIEE